MLHYVRASALLCVLVLLAWQQSAPVKAEAKEGEWAKGWNTWKNAEKGDWATYSMGVVNYKDEVTAAKDGKVTYTHTTFDAKGKELSSNERKDKAWNAIRLQGKLPYKKENLVEWKEETLDLEGVELKCDVAEWALGGVVAQIYFCKDVPCGGIVKTTSGGKDSVWLTGFHTSKSGEVKENPDKVATKSQLPRFWGTVGNRAVLKISGTGRDESYQSRKITVVEETSSKYDIVSCGKEGIPLPDSKPIEREQTKADWDKDYGKPDETGVTVTVGAGEFKCDVYKQKDEKTGKETTEWVSEGAPVKKLIKTKTSETVLELVKIEWE
ncbi:MAG: hypothetical protein KDB82_07920 [Planctomycetes bacterium]|nr:hypothetical protein [Planctomycetota bacterium]